MSDKICLPTEHHFLLMITFLLLTMFYIYNLGSMQNIDHNNGLNNNLATLSEHIRRLDTIPIIKNQPVQQRISKEESLRILTNKNTRNASNIAFKYPELVLDTQPRSLVTENITKNNLIDNDIIMTNLNGTIDKQLILTNQPTDILEQPTKVVISNPLQLESSLAVPDIQKRFALENRDHDAVFNEFRAPERRDPEHAYPTTQVKDMINLPTRGLPDNYHSVGVLVRKKDEKVLQLFGRQKYPGSSQWEYYVAGADSYGFPNKMPVVVRGDRELDDKQKIELPWLDKSKGDFEVNLYNYDVPRYNPFAF
jgi:hypothetical protein